MVRERGKGGSLLVRWASGRERASERASDGTILDERARERPSKQAVCSAPSFPPSLPPSLRRNQRKTIILLRKMTAPLSCAARTPARARELRQFAPSLVPPHPASSPSVNSSTSFRPSPPPRCGRCGEGESLRAARQSRARPGRVGGGSRQSRGGSAQSNRRAPTRESARANEPRSPCLRPMGLWAGWVGDHSPSPSHSLSRPQ